MGQMPGAAGLGHQCTDVRGRSQEVKELLETGRQKGFLTYDEVNDALPADIVSSDQIDDVMSMFGDNDIEIVDAQKAASAAEVKPTVAVEEESKEKEEEERKEGEGEERAESRGERAGQTAHHQTTKPSKRTRERRRRREEEHGHAIRRGPTPRSPPPAPLTL